jgi:signal peptidase I
VTTPAETDDLRGGGDEPPETGDGMSRSTRSLIEWVAVIVGALVVALVVKTFLVQAFYIPSESMVPTLEVRDRVLVNKLSYEFGDIARGDVVVFDRPGGPGPDGIAELIKRVVAVGGETVEAHDNQVFVDGEPIEEGYLPDGTVTSDFGPETVPEDHVWVMGDNRSASDDSRRFKSIPEDDVVGRAFVIIWPFSELGWL